MGQEPHTGPAALSWQVMARRELAAAAAGVDELTSVGEGTGRTRLIVIGAFQLGDCAARVDTDLHGDLAQEFHWRPAMLAGELATEILALRRTRPPLAAIDQAVASVVAADTPVGRELAGLARGARTVAVRSALELVGAICQHGPTARDTTFSVRAHQWPAGRFSLQAKSHIRRGGVGGVGGTIGLLSVDDRSVEIVLGHLALVASLASPGARLPELVAGYSTASGGWRSYRVTEALLDSALARVLDRVSEFIAARAGVGAPRSAGSWCAWCPLAEPCPARREWHSSPGRRNGGLPVDQGDVVGDST